VGLRVTEVALVVAKAGTEAKETVKESLSGSTTEGKE
jgi:hypothetical protein